MTIVEINLDLILEGIDEFKKQIAEGDFIQKQRKQEKDKLELQLQAFLNQNDVENAEHGLFAFGWKETKRKAFDQKLFGSTHPELLEEFKIEKISKKFEVKINS